MVAIRSEKKPVYTRGVTLIKAFAAEALGLTSWRQENCPDPGVVVLITSDGFLQLEVMPFEIIPTLPPDLELRFAVVEYLVDAPELERVISEQATVHVIIETSIERPDQAVLEALKALGRIPRDADLLSLDRERALPPLDEFEF
jgi:hypothetical protein